MRVGEAQVAKISPVDFQPRQGAKAVKRASVRATIMTEDDNIVTIDGYGVFQSIKDGQLVTEGGVKERFFVMGPSDSKNGFTHVKESKGTIAEKILTEYGKLIGEE